MDRFSRDQKPAAKAVDDARSAQTSTSRAASQVLAAPSAAAKIFIVMLVIVAFVVASALAAGLFTKSDRFVNDGQYQAVFLDNGQVYFGRLSNTGDKYVQLSDIYYLQVNQTVQPEQVEEGEEPAADQQSQISLAKLGNELHGPEDRMFIHRDKIVFWENLKTEGQVTTAIMDYVNSQNQ